MAAGEEGGMEEEPFITASYRPGSSSDPVRIGPWRLTAPGPEDLARSGPACTCTCARNRFPDPDPDPEFPAYRDTGSYTACTTCAAFKCPRKLQFCNIPNRKEQIRSELFQIPGTFRRRVSGYVSQSNSNSVGTLQR